ncbi:MAG: hypothetical protein M0R06_18055 [Sphaerochaeta sp.]|jgi:diketogulonate reductase-like aldo/keto reductase|nr:hypothetical protein [Sphaerochaeta sp.]
MKFKRATTQARKDALITARAIRVMGHILPDCNVNRVGITDGTHRQESMARHPREKIVRVAWSTIDKAEYGQGKERRKARQTVIRAIRETFEVTPCQTMD